jgi:gas vesicle protein
MFMRFRLTRLMMWMAMAAAAMYFLDPDRGEKRRQELRQKIQGYRKSAERTSRDMAKSV